MHRQSFTRDHLSHEQGAGNAQHDSYGHPAVSIDERQQVRLLQQDSVDGAVGHLMRLRSATDRSKRGLKPGQLLLIGRIVRGEMGYQQVLVALRTADQMRDGHGDADTSANVPHQVEQARGIRGRQLLRLREDHLPAKTQVVSTPRQRSYVVQMIISSERLDLVEIPQIARKVALSKKFDAVICLGAVIRGGTPHFEYIAAEVSKGVAMIGLESEVPVTFGVLTTDNLEQAIERAGSKAGNKGWDAALSAIEMANLYREMKVKK